MVPRDSCALAVDPALELAGVSEMEAIEKGAGVRPDCALVVAARPCSLEFTQVGNDDGRIQSGIARAIEKKGGAECPAEDEERLIERVPGGLGVAFTGDVASDPNNPTSTTPTSNDWSGYSGAAWRGQATLQKKGEKWHFAFQGSQLDADGGYLNLAVNGTATQSTTNGIVTTTFSNEVGLVSALSHFGGQADAADRCLTFSVFKAPV